MSTTNRRRVLRGMLGGAAITVGLPLLDCFLDNNGAAFADGAPLPVRFGTWFWGLGMNAKIWEPQKVGADYDLPEEIAAFKDIKKHVNLYTNFDVNTDGKPNLCHFSGWVALRAGTVPATRGALDTQSLDIIVSDAIGGGTRFRSLEMTATGNPRDSFSFRNANAVNPPEISPAEFYRRVFGAEFQDPNAATFKPNPKLMTRESVLSAVLEDASDVKRAVGAADRQKLDQYFTSIRELEQRLAIQLQKPPPAEACVIGKSVDADLPPGLDSETVKTRHKLMTQVLVMALACNQTKVFNMMYSDSGAVTSRKGYDKAHHPTTHEEMVDGALGYQPNVSWFVRKAMDSWVDLVTALDGVREGDGTLLDRTLVYAHSDQSFAKVHSITGIPMMTAGRAGGKIKSGLHVRGNGAMGTRVGLTAMRAVGLPLGEWGTGSMRVTESVSEILA